MGDVDGLFELMAGQHGAASTGQARANGVGWRAEQILIERGALAIPCPRVLVATGSPRTWRQLAMIATLAAGGTVLSHGAAARLHGLDGFDRYAYVDVVGGRGSWPQPPRGVVVHRTRGMTPDDLTAVDAIPCTTIAATLATLPATETIGRCAKALDAALRLGVPAADLHRTALRWRRRGRSGPAIMLTLIGERAEQRLPRSWFQRLAKRVLALAGIRLVDEFPVYSPGGVLLAELDLADPVRKIGVECQSWRWHGDPAAQHRDARRRGRLRMLGWEIVDVWWSDLHNPQRIVAEVNHLLAERSKTLDLTVARRVERGVVRTERGGGGW